MRISVRELKNHLSEYLRQAEAGEQIIVTAHGKPVCRLLAPQPVDSEVDTLARLRAQPWIRPGSGGKVLGSDKPINWPQGEKPLSRLILEDRE